MPVSITNMMKNPTASQWVHADRPGDSSDASSSIVSSSSTITKSSSGRDASPFVPDRAPAPYSLEKRAPFGDGIDGYEVVGPLGTGTFGAVHLVRRRLDDNFYAMKRLEKGIVVKLRQVVHVKSEKKVLASVDSPFVVRVYDYFQTPDTLFLVMDYIPGGELFSRGRQSEENARFYVAEAVIALEYLHRFNIVYRDIKPENTLICADGHIKLCDFSFAKEVDDLTWTICGTPEYMAPEIILSRGHGLSVDWWGLGVFTYELMVGRPPFSGGDQMKLYTSILSVSYHMPDALSPAAQSIIRSLIEKDLTLRLGCLARGAQEVKEHQFFDGIDWDRCAARELTPPWRPTLSAPGDKKYFNTAGQNFQRRFHHDLSFGTLFDDF